MYHTIVRAHGLDTYNKSDYYVRVPNTLYKGNVLLHDAQSRYVLLY